MVYNNLGNEGVLTAFSPMGGPLRPHHQKECFHPVAGIALSKAAQTKQPYLKT